MNDEDQLIVPSADEYRQALQELKVQFSETEKRAMRELYRRRNDLLPQPVADLAKTLGVTPDAANDLCFGLRRSLQAILPGKFTGLDFLATSTVHLAPKAIFRWRMHCGLAEGMELAGLTEG
jgi:hypothetical protein